MYTQSLILPIPKLSDVSGRLVLYFNRLFANIVQVACQHGLSQTSVTNATQWLQDLVRSWRNRRRTAVANVAVFVQKTQDRITVLKI